MTEQKKPVRSRSAAARKKELYKKSRYYQESRKRFYMIGGIGGAVLVLLLLIFGIRGCSSFLSSRKASSGNVVSMNSSSGSGKNGSAAADSSNASGTADAASDNSNNFASLTGSVSLTLSVVGDCTLGTDETFDYDTSLQSTLQIITATITVNRALKIHWLLWMTQESSISAMTRRLSWT